MANTKTVAVRSTVTTITTGTGTVLAHSATAPLASPYTYSLHDTTDPGQAGAHNEIWPRGSGNAVTFKQGVVVHHRDSSVTGNVTVTTA